MFATLLLSSLFLIYMDFTSAADGWAVSLLWAMMILPLGDVLLNTMQNLVSRIAGINNEDLSNRGIGMGATMAYTVRSIGAQFTSNNTTKSNVAKRVGGTAYGVGRSILNTGMFLAEGRNISPKGPIATRRNTEIENTAAEKLVTEKSDINDSEEHAE